VLIVADDPASPLPSTAASTCHRWPDRRRLEIRPPPEDMALLHFTSGTTGKPKGAVHVHEAVVAHYATSTYALDLHPDDVFWCTADPGWVTGTSYGIIAPLVHGATLISDAAEFEARRWYRVLADNRVTVWYTAPTALRMRYGAELPQSYDCPRCAA
jgi:acetyl-CoA synthetase